MCEEFLNRRRSQLVLDQQPARKNVCVWIFRAIVSKADRRSGATLGTPFKNEPAWHDLVLSTTFMARRRVCSIFGLNQFFERGDRARNAGIS